MCPTLQVQVVGIYFALCVRQDRDVDTPGKAARGLRVVIVVHAVLMCLGWPFMTVLALSSVAIRATHAAHNSALHRVLSAH